MKKNMLLGAAAIAAAGLIYKMHKEGKLDRVENGVSDFFDKAKREAKNAMDTGKNQMEYMKDRAEYGAKKITSEVKNAKM